MRRLILAAVAGLVLVAAVPTTSAATTCSKTYTVHMALRAIRSAYAGTRDVTKADRRHLHRFVRCQRNPAAKKFLHHVWARDISAWRARRAWNTSKVSWYNDAGTHCCGVYASYGVATPCTYNEPCYPQGTKVRFCYRGCVTAVVDDHGPYVPGRDWDLAESTAGAIGFGGVDYVKWRLVQ